MIAYIEGIVQRVIDHHLVIVVHGIGYDVQVPLQVLERAQTGNTVVLHTYHHIREDASDLYGFLHPDDLTFFIKLLGVNGVGPRLALGAISALKLEELKRAIVHGDTAMLQTISGIGRKTAERIILDLKESVDILPSHNMTDTEQHTSATALDALMTLGYTRSEAANALRHIDATLPLEEQVRAALKHVQQSR